MTDHKALQKIRALEEQYASAKQDFEKWKTQNASLKDTDSYKVYVENFSNWEKGVQQQLREFRTSLAKQPVSALPAQVPTADLDTQLREALEIVQPMEFIMAIFQTSSKDPNFLPSVFSAYHRLTGAGVPRATAAPPAPQPMYTAPPQYGYGYGSPSTSVVPGLQPTMAYSQQPTMSSSPHTNIRIPAQHPVQYAKVTPYGAIPSDWTLEEPVRKPMRPPSPIRSYEPSPMPFRDFSQK